MLFFLATSALAGPPPCSPIDTEFYLEGDHFWVRWDEAVGNPERGQEVLDWAETARSTYLDLGWPVTDQTILIRIEESASTGGLCSTTECDDGTIVPVITLFTPGLGDPSQNTTMHEVVHAFEYGYMGTYLDAINSWSWWLEGTAVWMTTHADGDLLEWRMDSREYLEIPWTGLHQTPLAYSDPSLTGYLYGTAYIAQYMEDRHGADSVRKTWEYGGDHTGTPIYFPDAVEAAGIEWEPFWQDFMATTTVLDLPYGDDMTVGTFIEKHVRDLPADGSPKNARQPQGLGISIIHFKKDVGQEDRSLDVSFQGDPEVPWMAVLVRTKKTGPGGKVKEIVPLEIDDEGRGSASLSEFDGSNEGYLVVSPQDMALEPHDYSWTAELGGGPVIAPEEKSGCGCQSTGGSAGWFALFAVVLAGRLRRR